MNRHWRRALPTSIAVIAAATLTAQEPAATRADPYVTKPRVVVMTDIANEPDDQMSMVRFLVYANQFDVEGLVATTSIWMRSTVRPDVILSLLDAYDQVQPNLLKHQAGFPSAETLKRLVVAGQPGFGMQAVGPLVLPTSMSDEISVVSRTPGT